MTNSNILNIIASYAQLNAEDFLNTNISFDGDFCEVSFNCELMHYHCFIDTASGELAGFLFEPITTALALGNKYAA